MNLNSLNAISPVDGRYRTQTAELAPYFSEAALMKYRLRVEVEYFIALCGIPLPELKKVEISSLEKLKTLYQEFSETDALHIKDQEKITNHDVKALEYFLKEKLSNSGLSAFKEFIHFGLTSQDINNTAFPLAIKEVIFNLYVPLLRDVVHQLQELSLKWNDIPMLSRTHGQPASPTRLGKEIMVFVERLNSQQSLLHQIPNTAKFGGASGNFNAHHVAYPAIDWKAFADRFLREQFGLERQQHTTQIEHYDNLCALFDGLKRINNILIDLNRDIWTYISMDYFKQEIRSDEIGSSAMPHKVNPIDFENSEGNLGLANALFEYLSAKLPISRLQRDLTDSTVLRNVGVPFSHTVIAMKSLLKGLRKLLVNQDAIRKDLDDNWAVVTEALQTILRKEGFPDPYESLKKFSRNHEKLTQASLHNYIDSLNISAGLKVQLKNITPFNYTGI